jgi:hypothetical protein
MKKFLFILLPILAMMLLITLSLFSYDNVSVVGRICIPSINASTEVYAALTDGCDCCAELWHGGQASTYLDLSEVRIDDKASLILLSGQRLVLECVEITNCIRIGRWFVSWHGILKANGDVLVFNNGMVYRWVIL